MTDTELTAVDQIKIGDFVKLVDRDNSGRFSYVGEVINVQNENKVLPSSFEMLTFEGIMGFTFPRKDKPDDGIRIGSKEEEVKNELYVTTIKPKGWSKFKKNPTSFADTKKEEATIVPVKPKKERVFGLVAANPRKKESALLKLAKKEIGGSETQLKNYIKLALAKK